MSKIIQVQLFSISSLCSVIRFRVPFGVRTKLYFDMIPTFIVEFVGAIILQPLLTLYFLFLFSVPHMLLVTHVLTVFPTELGTKFYKQILLNFTNFVNLSLVRLIKGTVRSTHKPNC